jgi:TrmH family RNA methyltransferase
MDVPVKPLKWYRRLATAKGRQEAGAFAVEGKKAISQIIAGHADKILEILTVDEPPPDFRRFPAGRITESQCRYVSGTQTPQGIIAIVRVPEGIYSSRLPENPGKRILLLDGVQDPGNTGTLIRTAAAFDFSGIIMSGKCADPLSPKCVQAASGTTLSVWIRRTESYVKLAQQLKMSGFTTLAADIDGNDSPSVAAQNEQLILALGNEAAGLSKEILDLADYRLYVPIKRAKAESLNVAACGAILMYLSTRAAATNQPR